MTSVRSPITDHRTLILLITILSGCLFILLSSARAAAQRQSSRAEKRTSPTESRSSKQDVLDLTFDDLVFDMKKGDEFKRSMLTKKINDFNGSNIRLRGFIRPSFTQQGITKFIFVRDNKECCFGPGAALYDCVLVKLAEGVETDFTTRPIIVEGKFYLKEYKGPDGKVWSIYRMKEGKVK
jgi:hypothetical protein